MKLLEAVVKLFMEGDFTTSITKIPPEFIEALALGGKTPIDDISVVKHAFSMEGINFEPVGVAVSEKKDAIYMGCMRFMGGYGAKAPEYPKGGYPEMKPDKYGIPDYNKVGIILLPEEDGVHLDSLFMRSPEQGKGNAGEFLLRQVALYETMGFTEIMIQAAHIGRYVWYTLGFTPDDEEDLVDTVYEGLVEYAPWLEEIVPPVSLGDFYNINVNRSQFKAWLDANPEAKVETFVEFLNDPRFLKRGPDGDVVFRLAKYFMLYHKKGMAGMGWESIMSVSELKARLTNAVG